MSSKITFYKTLQWCDAFDSFYDYRIIPGYEHTNGYNRYGYMYFDNSSYPLKQVDTHIPFPKGFDFGANPPTCMKVMDGTLYAIRGGTNHLEMYMIQNGKPVFGELGLVCGKTSVILSEVPLIPCPSLVPEMVAIANSLWLMNRQGILFEVDYR